MATYYRGSIKLFFKGDPTLRAYYSFDISNGLVDESGNGYHLINNNNCEFGFSILPSKLGKAVNLGINNTNKYLYGTANIGLNDGPQTIIVWGSYLQEPPTDSWGVDTRGYVLAKHGGYRGIYEISYGITYGQTAPNEFRVRYWQDRSGLAIDWVDYYKRLSLNKPYLFVLTYNGNGIINGYLDGKLVASGTVPLTSGNYNFDSANVSIGARRTVTGSYVEGVASARIDEVAFFKRVLSPTEILSYYKWATGQKKVFSFSPFFFFSESSFLISGQTISQIKTQNSTTFSLSVSESNKLKTFPSSSIQFLTTANSKREIPKQLIKDIKTEKINFDITNQP